MSSPPSSSNTIKFAAQAITQGVPNVVDEAFTSAMTKAMAGGPALQEYLDACAQTSVFWNWVATNSSEGVRIFAPAVTTDNQLVMIASNGNTSFRMGYFLNEAAFDENGFYVHPTGEDTTPPAFGTGQIQLGNTTTDASKWASFALTLAAIPVGIYLTKKLVMSLLKPAFQNAAIWITKNADTLAQYAGLYSDVNYYSIANSSVDAANDSLEPVEGEIEEGVEYVAIDWTASLLTVGGMVAVAAIPMLVSALGHQMMLSVTVQNGTNIDFDWAISYQASGQPNALPGTDATDYTIPKIGTYTDQWGDKTLASYEASFQFINTSDYGSIGLVLTLNPADGTTPAQIVISIPWAGDNTIWLGASSDSPEDIYNANYLPNGDLTTTVAFDTFSVTVAISALSGETNGAYTYSVVATINKLSS